MLRLKYVAQEPDTQQLERRVPLLLCLQLQGEESCLGTRQVAGMLGESELTPHSRQKISAQVSALCFLGP